MGSGGKKNAKTSKMVERVGTECVYMCGGKDINKIIGWVDCDELSNDSRVGFHEFRDDFTRGQKATPRETET